MRRGIHGLSISSVPKGMVIWEVLNVRGCRPSTTSLLVTGTSPLKQQPITKRGGGVEAIARHGVCERSPYVAKYTYCTTTLEVVGMMIRVEMELPNRRVNENHERSHLKTQRERKRERKG